MNGPAGRPDLPSFAQFMAGKPALLARSPNLVDLTETRLAKALRPWSRDPGTLALPTTTGHRCHVADHWLDCFGLPTDWKPLALVTQGVRQSLACLFGFWARQGCRVLVPGDVYPVYLELARQAHCPVDTFASFPQLRLEGLACADVVLLTHPFKSRHGELTDGEQACLHDWLRADARRRVVVDAVYTFDTRLSASAMALHATGQALLLHSLSKGWASPLLAGVALVPAVDVDRLTPVMRALDIDKAGLRLAQALLQQDRSRPDVLRRRLQGFELDLRASLAAHGLSLPAAAAEGTGQYLFVVDQPWQALLQQGLLALPLSTFGSSLTGHSVVSSLPPWGPVRG